LPGVFAANETIRKLHPARAAETGPKNEGLEFVCGRLTVMTGLTKLTVNWVNPVNLVPAFFYASTTLRQTRRLSEAAFVHAGDDHPT
jgi:hypothetical protein